MKRPLRMHLFHEAFTGLTLVRRVCRALVAAAALILATSATAAWNTAPETIQQHPTWIYTPSTLMNNGKHVLLVALHGCDQSHDQIKNFGNLDGTAEANAIVVAVPSVGAKVWSGNPVAKCWDYNGANDAQKDVADLISLANELMNRQALKIDPNHVYVVGLSSGAALALDLGCKAPDVFAGVGAIAGSVAITVDGRA